MATLKTILRSTVFQRVLASCAVFVTLSLLVIWTLGPFRISQIEAAEQDVITEAIEFGISLQEEDGSDALIAQTRWDTNRDIWTDEDIFVILEDEETLLAYRDPDGEIIAGFAGL